MLLQYNTILDKIVYGTASAILQDSLVDVPLLNLSHPQLI